jgi:transcriptional regulator with XRE-family HTH domain
LDAAAAFGTVLRRLRNEAELTQEELAFEADMIIESTHPDCAKGSRFASQIGELRKALDTALGGPIHARKQTRLLVTVTGVGFFDRIHGQEGVAPNGIELHPLLHVLPHQHKTIQDLKKAVRSKGEDQ